jgi:arylsulfatase A-like enzyme
MTSTSTSQKPNVLVLLTDDQGYGDLSCMGATDFRTPHLDRLASHGVRFTNWYSNSPVCSPSRASLLTGRYPARAGVRAILSGHRTATGLDRDVPTIAVALKALGYQTAFFGKWHLGLAEGSRPQDHGFDESFGFMAGAIDYYSHIYYGWGAGAQTQIHDLWHNGREIWNNGIYFTDQVADRTVEFLRSSANRERPFLTYVAFNAPHWPMHAPRKYLDRFPRLSPDRRIMAAMLSAMDDAVGAILDELERQGLYEDTLIFFQSDNGPSREVRNWLDGRRDPYYGGSAGLLKGHKFSLFEGGIRVPALMSWPARIPSRRVVDGVGVAMDIFPTVLRAAGGDPGSYRLDGLDVLPMVADRAPSPHTDVFWEMENQTAIRRANWKLVLNGQLVEGEPPQDPVFLSDLSTDASERNNVKQQYPQLTSELKAAAEAWRADIESEWSSEGRGTVTHVLQRALGHQGSA